MSSIQSLPPDQRAVLELVLRRGRTYDEIAQLLSIDRAGVRQRALSALDALGPDAGVPAERRALITDYLLGALPPRVHEQVRDRLAQAPGERAWARVIAAELESVASHPLPEIPGPEAEGSRPAAVAPLPPLPEPETRVPPAPEERQPPRPGGARPERGRQRRGERRAERREREAERRGDLGPRSPIEPGRERPSSRRGGRMVLIAVLIVVVAVILALNLAGGSNKPAATTGASTTPTTPTTTTPTTPTTTTPTGGKVVGQIVLKPPSGGKAAGVAELLQENSKVGLAIVAEGLVPNTHHNAYAVWLSNSPTDSRLLGFVSPPVGSNGRLSTAGSLPSNASHYTKLLVTVETQPKPSSPGTVVLEGTLGHIP